MSSTIQIYNGKGISYPLVKALIRELDCRIDKNLYKIETFNRFYLRPLTERHVSLLIIPGGELTKAADDLRSCSDQITELMNKPLNIYLSCFGAIACCSNFTTYRIGFTPHTNSLKTHTGLDFQDVATLAPFYLPGKKELIKNLVTLPVDHFQLGTHRFFHAYGPCFDIKDQLVDVVGSYTIKGNFPEIDSPAATISYQNKHNVLATGIHPEIGLVDLPEMRKEVGDPLLSLTEEIQASEQARDPVLRHYFTKLNLKLHD